MAGNPAQRVAEQAEERRGRFDGEDLSGFGVHQSSCGALTFDRCNLAGFKAIDSTFPRFSANAASAPDANLSGSDFHAADFTRADLRRIVAKGTNFTGALFGDAILLDGDFSDAILRSAEMFDARAVGTRFCRTNLAAAQMQRLTAARAEFIETDLTGADLRAANLQETSFIACALNAIDLTNCDLGGARFIECDLDGSTLSGASFEEVRFENTTLRNVQAMETIFPRALFERGIISGSFHGAVLDSAVFRGTQFGRISGRADWPEGLPPTRGSSRADRTASEAKNVEILRRELDANIAAVRQSLVPGHTRVGPGACAVCGFQTPLRGQTTCIDHSSRKQVRAAQRVTPRGQCIAQTKDLRGCGGQAITRSGLCHHHGVLMPLAAKPDAPASGGCLGFC